jgi:selT/selW/selH-like putative selenoprotein
VATQPGASGQFDILRDGSVVFSKRETKRFPEPGEVLRLLQR